MYSSEVVAAAEAELVRRSAGGEERLLRKVRRAATVCAVLGAFVMVWGLSMAAFGVSTLGPSGVEPLTEPFVFRHFRIIYVVGAILEGIAGGILLWGGLELRKLRSRGRFLVVAVLWLGFAMIAVFTVVSFLSLPWLGTHGSAPVGMWVAGLINAAFWSFLLWLPYRFFTSARVRNACSQ